MLYNTGKGLWVIFYVLAALLDRCFASLASTLHAASLHIRPYIFCPYNKNSVETVFFWLAFRKSERRGGIFVADKLFHYEKLAIYLFDSAAYVQLCGTSDN